MRTRLIIDESIAAVIRQRAGQKRISPQDYMRLLLERGLFADSSAKELELIAADVRFTAHLLSGLVRRVARPEPAEADRLIAQARAQAQSQAGGEHHDR